MAFLRFLFLLLRFALRTNPDLYKRFLAIVRSDASFLMDPPAVVMPYVPLTDDSAGEPSADCQDTPRTLAESNKCETAPPFPSEKEIQEYLRDPDVSAKFARLGELLLASLSFASAVFHLLHHDIWFLAPLKLVILSCGPWTYLCVFTLQFPRRSRKSCSGSASMRASASSLTVKSRCQYTSTSFAMASRRKRTPKAKR